MKPITYPQVQSLLLKAGVPLKVLSEPSDMLYIPPQLDWLLGEYHEWFFKVLWSFEIRDYNPEDMDCDDYADWFAILARGLHRRTLKAQMISINAAIPIGRFNFLQRPDDEDKGKHAVDWAVVVSGQSDPFLVFVEPQVLGKRLFLQPNQIQSCTRCSD